MKTKKISIIRMIIMTVIAVCFFCNLTMVAHAENDVTEIKQTAAGENTVMVSWKRQKVRMVIMYTYRQMVLLL